ncbi:polynucleotide 5'-hydroxyl-kinase NOL9 [Contarinia nasturtii]|uniref:polynucleotide 5'-hydroxyl-kinase NOL9 n=1 Tax=Contarinia nasturtii TaxID=265458 RepID=UPI0012D44FE7|nr:polynucleotide 5'-hydroxyl-kinase NOL9 [Contarinia nasturtii]
MAKNQHKKPQKHAAVTTDMKMKNKIAKKLKNKLKSAIFNQQNPSTESLIQEAKTQKAKVKLNIPVTSSGIDFKPKDSPSVNEPNKNKKKPKHFKKNEKNGKEHCIQNGGQGFNTKINDHGLSIKNKTKPVTTDQSTSIHTKKNASVEMNGYESKKKKKQKKKFNQAATAGPSTSKPSNDQDSSCKRKVDGSKVNKAVGKKRLKTVGGFVETNANDEEETKIVSEKLKKKQKKLTSKLNKEEDAPKIKVHNVDASKNKNSDSDSEADSYIDKFFGDGNNDFDENHIYSLDEIEAKNENNFLSKGSGDESTLAPDDSSPVGKKNKKKQKHLSKESMSSENNKLVSYKKNHADESEYDFDEYAWLGGDEEEIYTDSDYDDSDSMYGSDSEISLGSEVIDTDDTYECESTDVESMVEYEDDMSYDEYEDHTSDSEYDYSENESDTSSGCTYDDFRNSRYDEHSSNDDHEYMDDAYDDVCIAQGTAITHKIIDKRIKLFENDTESRIIELPKSDSDDDSSVELIPINVNKTKFKKFEHEKRMAKEAERNKQLMAEEQKRFAYEKSIEDYYNMDNLNKCASLNDVNTSINAVSIIKCPKNLDQSSLDWLEDCDVAKPMDEEFEFQQPKTNLKNVVVVSIPDPFVTQSPAKQTRAKQQTPSVKNQEAKSHVSPKINSSADFCIEDEDNSMSTESLNSSQFFNSVNSRHVLLLLRKTLHFHGSLHVKLIAGKAIAFGYELQPNKTVTVHSPRGHGLICLIPKSSGAENLKLLDALKGDFYLQDINYLKEAFNSNNDAILLLERDQTNKGVNMIERYMRETVFPNINAFNNESPFYSSEFVLHCKFLNEPENGLVLNDEWLTLNLKNSSKLITIGGKGVGKSTFVRYLINSHFDKFKKFLFIDLDIGQPELFVPQTLSATIVTEPFLGPGYLRNVKPTKSVLFGDINVLPDPFKYWRCVTEIFKFCASNKEFAKMPWIINTMGYSRGFGTELIACISKLFKPTDLVQIQSRSTMENFDQIMMDDIVNNFKFNVFKSELDEITGKCVYRTHIFNAVRDKSNHKHVDMNAKDIRYTMILAKLGNCLKSNSDWLTSVKPFEASLNDLDILVTSGVEINPADYLDLLNGNLVYLCEKHSESGNDIVDCHGIGIVRSVDASTNKVYLISTIPLDELRMVNVLAIGAIPLPSAVFLNQHSQIRGAVPYVYNSDKFVGSKQVAQHIFRAESKSSNKPIQLIED